MYRYHNGAFERESESLEVGFAFHLGYDCDKKANQWRFALLALTV
jgi:hypothetical protein